MIPEKIMIRIGCDACDAGVTVTLDEDVIDDTGWDLALEGQLIDSGWGVADRMTFCPRCMEGRRLWRCASSHARRSIRRPHMSVYDRPILDYVREHPRATTREIAINIFGKAEHVSHAWKRCDRLKEAAHVSI